MISRGQTLENLQRSVSLLQALDLGICRILNQMCQWQCEMTAGVEQNRGGPPPEELLHRGNQQLQLVKQLIGEVCFDDKPLLAGDSFALCVPVEDTVLWIMNLGGLRAHCLGKNTCRSFSRLASLHLCSWSSVESGIVLTTEASQELLDFQAQVRQKTEELQKLGLSYLYQVRRQQRHS